jgi:hypothetical protein
MSLDRPDSQARVVGHGYSLWLWNEVPVAYASNIQHRSPQALSPAVDIQPLNHIRPKEILTGRAIGRGEITMTVTELYGQRAWSHLTGTFGEGYDQFNDLADVFHNFRRFHTEFTPAGTPRFIKIIRAPASNGVQAEEYMNIRILDVREDESASVDAMNNELQITIGYTHKINRGNPLTGNGAEGTVGKINSKIY